MLTFYASNLTRESALCQIQQRSEQRYLASDARPLLPRQCEQESRLAASQRDVIIEQLVQPLKEKLYYYYIIISLISDFIM